jgi:tetratricopeptide (TPR) repeat protein
MVELLMRLRIAFVAALLTFARVAPGQSAAEHVAMGDREHAALNYAASLKHYEAAIAADPTNYDALVKAAYDAVDLGEFNPSAAQRDTLYKKAMDFARRAVAKNPGDSEGHFQLARAIGRNALTMGTRDRIKYAGEVRAHALEALKIDPKHSGALHVMGEWNAEVMRLSGMSRMIAKNFLGGQVFGEASWDNAQRYLEEAVANDPNRITHRLDLGRVYADRKQKDKAREQFTFIDKAAPADFNDRSYKEKAQRLLKDLD